MKSYSSLACFLGACMALVTPVVQSAPPVKDAPKKPGSKPASASDITVTEVTIPQSVFVLPADPKAGKDPFFPASIRPFAGSAVASKGKTPEYVDVPLTLNGITPAKKLAMVNGRTFLEGEEGEVVANGVRKKIRCLKVTEESVLVELLPEGLRRELKMRFGSLP
jgi:hypothetical protein